MTSEERGPSAGNSPAHLLLPPITVVIPSLRGRSCVHVAVESALEQQGVQREVVLVLDDCDATDAARIEKMYGHDCAVRILLHANRSASISRNLGVEAARHPWIAFLDDDDVMRPDRLRFMLTAAAMHGARWVISGAERLDMRTGRIRLESARQVDLTRLLVSNMVPGGGSGVVVERQLVLEVGGFDHRLKNAEDWDLWIRLAANGPPASVDKSTLLRRVSAEGKGGALLGSLHALSRIWWKYRRLRRRNGVRLDTVGYLRWVARRQRVRLRPASTRGAEREML